MEYCIANGPNRLDLEDYVREMMKAGWRPDGGIAICPRSGTFYQAMVRG